jgi:hypothetical protein
MESKDPASDKIGIDVVGNFDGKNLRHREVVAGRDPSTAQEFASRTLASLRMTEQTYFVWWATLAPNLALKMWAIACGHRGVIGEYKSVLRIDVFVRPRPGNLSDRPQT